MDWTDSAWCWCPCFSFNNSCKVIFSSHWLTDCVSYLAFGIVTPSTEEPCQPIIPKHFHVIALISLAFLLFTEDKNYTAVFFNSKPLEVENDLRSWWLQQEMARPATLYIISVCERLWNTVQDRWDSVQEHLLCMILVNSSVHSNSGAQLLSRFVVTNLPQHCHQSGGTQVCCPCRYYLTHPPSGYAVFNGRVQTQTPQHLFSTRQTFLISASKSEYKAHGLLWVDEWIKNKL